MNTLKSVVVIAVLGVVAYGVYITLTDQPAPQTPDWLPPEIAGGMNSPDVQIGEAGGLPALAGSANDPLAGFNQQPKLGAPATGTPHLDALQSGGDLPPGAAAANYGGSNEGVATDPLSRSQYAGLAPEAGGNPLNSAAAGNGSIYGAQQASAVEPASVYRRDANQLGAKPVDQADADTGGFGKSMEAAQAQLRGGDLPMALLTLSFWYDNPKLTAAEDAQLNTLLDQLAGSVIYSQQSMIESPHRVTTRERLEDVARKWEVTPQLLAKINALDPGSRPEPGSELKVVRGPFNASINLGKQRLALMVGGRYAGRFPIRTSSNFTPLVRQYFVQVKTINPPFTRPDGSQAAAGSRDTFLITRRIELVSRTSPGAASGQVQIIGCDDPAILQSPAYAGAILLSSRDADDVFDILTEASRVTIDR